MVTISGFGWILVTLNLKDCYECILCNFWYIFWQQRMRNVEDDCFDKIWLYGVFYLLAWYQLWYSSSHVSTKWKVWHWMVDLYINCSFYYKVYFMAIYASFCGSLYWSFIDREFLLYHCVVLTMVILSRFEWILVVLN